MATGKTSGLGLGGILSAAFEEQLIWNKGRPIIGHDPALWRMDDHENLIYRHAYGNRQSEHGWEIDHRAPTGLGGGDDLANKRPLHWRANAQLGGLLSALLAR